MATKKEKFDGRSRPSNDTYRKRFDEIFKPKTLHEELMEGFKKEQEDLKDEEVTGYYINGYEDKGIQVLTKKKDS